MTSRTLLLLFFAYISFVCADILKHDELTLPAGSIATLWVSTMFSSSDAPSNTPPGDGRSFVEVSFDLEVTEFKQTPPAFVQFQIGLLQAEDINVLGDGSGYNFCCNPLDPTTKCNEHELYISPKVRDKSFVWIRTVELPATGSTHMYNMIAPLPASGKYVLFASHCDRRGASAVKLKGKSVWMNPYGYLPGHLFGYLPFYGFLTLVYLFVVLGWIINILCYRSEIIRVHKFFSAILLLCIIESSSCYYDYLLYNNNGNPFKPLVTTCVVSKVAHQSFSRAILVALSLGYGVTRLSLGTYKMPLNQLTVAYFLAILSREYVFRQGTHTSNEFNIYMLILNFISALLESIFLCWVFLALRETIVQLRATRQEVKLTLYYKFASVLIIFCIAVVGFIIYSIIYKVLVLDSKQWDVWWFVDIGFWQMSYFFVLSAIAILWRPSKISKRFEYSEITEGTEMSIVEDGAVEDGTNDVNVNDPPQYVVSSDEDLSEY